MDMAMMPNQESALKTAEFLEACNLIFEKGMLSHRRINNANSPVLENIKKGIEFFQKWCHDHKETGISQIGHFNIYY